MAVYPEYTPAQGMKKNYVGISKEVLHDGNPAYFPGFIFNTRHLSFVLPGHVCSWRGGWVMPLEGCSHCVLCLSCSTAKQLLTLNC